MNIKSLEKMEEIVRKNRFLRWDGWTVVNAFPNDRGATMPNGIRIDGRWHIQYRYEPNENGWNIPDKLVR